jgi:hypothetical protein
LSAAYGKRAKKVGGQGGEETNLHLYGSGTRHTCMLNSVLRTSFTHIHQSRHDDFEIMRFKTDGRSEGEKALFICAQALIMARNADDRPFECKNPHDNADSKGCNW